MLYSRTELQNPDGYLRCGDESLIDMEQKTLPLVTIGIPTYNGGHRLFRPLKSIWAQNYPNLEVVISDNCSTDDTKNIVGNICKEHPQIKYVRQDKNIGQIPNYYFLIQAAKGKYFMWLADDDFLEPDFLLRAVDFMETHDDYSLASAEFNTGMTLYPMRWSTVLRLRKIRRIASCQILLKSNLRRVDARPD
jgi:GT2 family glycosyltransferase